MTNEEIIIGLISKIDRNIARINNYGYGRGMGMGRGYNFGPDLRTRGFKRDRFSAGTNIDQAEDDAFCFGRGRGRGLQGRCGGYNLGRGGRGFGRGRERLLTYIKKNPGISQGELAKLVEIRPQSLSEIVNKLVVDGYVEKKTNENDRRITQLFLTPAGNNRADEFRCFRAELASKALSSLSEEEQKQLITLLEKVSSQF